MQRSTLKTRFKSFLTVAPDPEESLRFTDEVIQKTLQVMEDRRDEPKRKDRLPEAS